MTREEMKKMLPIIQAYVDGKAVEYYNEHESEWVPFDKEYSFFITFFDSPEAYRIKPDPKYRPFKDAEECWNEMSKHQPFGWIKSFDEEPWYENITIVMETMVWSDVCNGKTEPMSYKKTMDEYTFADGTPFGIKEGGEE